MTAIAGVVSLNLLFCPGSRSIAARALLTFIGRLAGSESFR
jgi:hypothetical protein